ncbi:hypothetical protein [Dyadobacter bucti]|uniref:hypothetical protein n=1 Tax=Dyadobacter bucti TaxID=2572203 RepID=UPI0011098978|nr:hypothetical protein [Dyadobacter bucti]
MQRFRVLLIFYRQFRLPTNTISLLMWAMAGAPTISSEKFLSFLIYFFWLRSACQLLVWYLFRLTNQKGLVFYHHFGLSKIQLAAGVYVLDLLIFSLCIGLVSLSFG